MGAEEGLLERKRVSPETDGVVWGLKEAADYLHVSYSTVGRMRD